MIIHKIEKIIAWLFWVFGLTKLILAWNRFRGKVPIIMYHSIQPKPKPGQKVPMVWQIDMAVSPQMFEEQIRVLSQWYKCVSLKEYVKTRHKKLKENKKLLVITFDDGYIDNLEVAVPILQRYKAKATFFMVGCHLEKERPSPIALYNMVYDNSSPEEKARIHQTLDRRQLVRAGAEALDMSAVLYSEGFESLDWQSSFISVEQAQKMHFQGFEVAAHGYYHIIPSALDVSSFNEDILHVKRVISDTILEKSPGFAFPFGTPSVTNKDKSKAVDSAGFLYAATSREGVNTCKTNNFELCRIAMEEVPLYITMFRLTGLRATLKHF